MLRRLLSRERQELVLRRADASDVQDKRRAASAAARTEEIGEGAVRAATLGHADRVHALVEQLELRHHGDRDTPPLA
jgi:hypothetical protein